MSIIIKRWGLALVVTALIVRALYFAGLSETLYVAYPLVDAKTFVEKAQDIAFVSIWGESTAYFHEPFYIYTLALLFRVFGYDLQMAYVLNILLGCANVLFTYILARQLLPRHPVVARLSGLAAALCGPMVFFDCQLLRTTMATFFNLLMFLWFLAGQHHPRRRWGLLLGIILGIAALTRANILIFLPVIMIVLWRRGPRGWTALLWFMIGLALTIGPITLRNTTMASRPVLISSNWGLNLFLGNNPDSDTTLAIRPGYYWKKFYALPAQAGHADLSYMGRMDYYAARVENWIKDDPLGFLALQAKKTWRFLRGFEIYRNIDPYFVGYQVPFLRFLLWQRGGLNFPTGLIIPFALIGFWELRRDWRTHFAWFSFVLLYASSVILFFVVSRYRVPLLPFLLPAAFFGLRTLYHTERTGDFWKPLVLVLLLVLLNGDWSDGDRVDPAEGYRQLGDAARRAGQLDDATAYYRRALAVRPDGPQLLNSLGAILHHTGEFAEAEKHYRHALAIDPRFTLARANLQKLITDRELTERYRAELATPRSVSQAAALARQALADGLTGTVVVQLLRQATPGDNDALERSLMLSEVYYQQGDFARAEQQAAQALADQPQNAALLLARAWARYGREDYLGAGRDLRQASAIAPGDSAITRAIIMTELKGGLIPFIIDPQTLPAYME